MSISITPKDLLDAGVHFGHQTKRWNPRSKPFVFDHRQGISIIDLGKTHAALDAAVTFLENIVANGGNVLLVGTKRQAKEIVREAAAATKPDAEGWSRLPEGRTLSLYAAHDGVPLSVSRVEAVAVRGTLVRARTAKGETYLLSLDDLFAAATDGAGPTARKAGFVG